MQHQTELELQNSKIQTMESQMTAQHSHAETERADLTCQLAVLEAQRAALEASFQQDTATQTASTTEFEVKRKAWTVVRDAFMELEGTYKQKQLSISASLQECIAQKTALAHQIDAMLVRISGIAPKAAAIQDALNVSMGVLKARLAILQTELASLLASAGEETRLKKARAKMQAQEAEMLARECEQDEADILRGHAALGLLPGNLDA